MQLTSFVVTVAAEEDTGRGPAMLTVSLTDGRTASSRSEVLTEAQLTSLTEWLNEQVG